MDVGEVRTGIADTVRLWPQVFPVPSLRDALEVAFHEDSPVDQPDLGTPAINVHQGRPHIIAGVISVRQDGAMCRLDEVVHFRGEGGGRGGGEGRIVGRQIAIRVDYRHDGGG